MAYQDENDDDQDEHAYQDESDDDQDEHPHRRNGSKNNEYIFLRKRLKKMSPFFFCQCSYPDNPQYLGKATRT